MLEAVKKDLDELSTAVKTEATNAGSAIAETLNVGKVVVASLTHSVTNSLAL